MQDWEFVVHRPPLRDLALEVREAIEELEASDLMRLEEVLDLMHQVRLESP